MTAVRAAHEAVPIEDSWYEEASTRPANLRAFASYPVIAVCERCHGRIRRAEPAQAQWSHVAAAPGARETAEVA